MKKFLASVLVFLVAFMTAGCFSFSLGGFTYDDDGYEEYSVFKAEDHDFSGVTKVNIEWISGETEIRQGDFAVSDSATKGEFFPSYYKLSGNQLWVKFAKNGTSYSYLNDKSKALSITLPATFAEIELKVVSANYDVDLILMDKLNVDAVSGEGNVRITTLGSADINTVSGNVTMKVSTVNLTSLSFHSVSANVELNADILKKPNVKFESVSGNLTLKNYLV
ncbi:MAG: DUF4097 family beta strand repeat protein [Clostridia bacterium]|nr:DUF4097 family beta strand repeat protein [Clostridia bacterium]